MSNLLTRIIYDEDGTEILRYEKVILEKQHIFDFVCLSVPTPDFPGSDIPFITLDPNNFYSRQKKFSLNTNLNTLRKTHKKH